MERYFSTFDVAKMCHVSPASVTRWIADGKLAAGRTVGGHKRIPLDAVLTLLQELDMPLPEELGSEMRSGMRPLILIVDDDISMLTMLKKFFNREFPGYEIDEAKDGFGAGWILQKKKPQLVLLDLMLPGINGFDVCTLIRKSAELQKTKIIVTTGFGGDNCRKALELGANDFIQKPFEWDTLKRKIQDQLTDESNGRQQAAG